MEDNNFYELLGIPADAPSSKIKKAYKKLALMYHPDKVQNLGPKLKEVANEEMKKLNIAKDILLDEAERRAYDASLRGPKTPTVGGAAPGPGREEIMQLNNVLIAARKFIDDLRKINGDVREAENFFIQAKYAVNKNDITRAIEMAQHSKEAAKAVLYKYAVNVLLLTKEKLVKHRDRGADISVAFDRFLEARNAMMKDGYLEAVNISVQAVNMANEIAKKLLETTGPVKTKAPPMPKSPEKEKEPAPPEPPGATEAPPIPEGYVAEWDEESHLKDVDIYRSALVKVWADGIVTQEEQDELDRLKEELGLGSKEHEELEREVRDRRKDNVKIYLDAMMRVLEDDIIDNEEHKELAQLREKLKLEKDSEFSI